MLIGQNRAAWNISTVEYRPSRSATVHLGSNSKNERRSTASHEDAGLQKFRRVVVRYERHAEKLPRDASPRLSFNPTQAFMRQVLLF